MPLTQVGIKTTLPFYDSSGRPLAGVKVTYKLDRNDFDTASAAFIYASVEEFVTLDAAGLLPLSTLKLWPNSRGNTGSRWLIGLKQGDVYLSDPVPCYIKEPLVPGTESELADVLNNSAPAAWLLPNR